MSHGRCDSIAAEGQRIFVLGATSLVAGPLLPRLVAEGFNVTAVSRQQVPAIRTTAGVTWQVGDLSGSWRPDEDVTVVLHLAPLWLLPPLVESLAQWGMRRLVAFGSTSRFGRGRSSSAADRALAARLARAEAELDRAARGHGVRWTVFRPTLVYGEGRDRSVATMAAFARRFGFIPVAGRARGRRQPVRARDLAEACLTVLERPDTDDRAYNLPGGETLTFHQMAERITLSVLGERRVVRLPLPVLRGLILAASRLPSLSHLDPEMANRMNEDLVFDAADARRDFGWDPGPFEPPPYEPSC